MVKKLLTALIVVTGWGAMSAEASIINFESGFTDQQAVTGVLAPDGNLVTFQVGAAASSLSSAFIAKVGGNTAASVTAFVSQDTPDGSAGGSYFLTDEFNGPSTTFDYFMTFGSPVIDLSVDVYDYRVDGGPAPGATATLNVFSDLFTTTLASTSWTIPTTNPVDGNVVTLSVTGGPIKSASIVFSQGDVGTGIDNITYTHSMPEPTTMLVWGCLFGFGLIASRRRRTRCAA